jgi:type VI protein secretion system component Hcp
MIERKTSLNRIVWAACAGGSLCLVLAAARLHAAAASETLQGPTGRTATAQMRIEGVNGGAATPIASFTLGATDTVSSGGSGGGAGKVTFSNLVVSKSVDGDSVPLLQAASTGQVLRTLSIDVFTSGSQAPFARYTFDDVIVTSTVLGATSLTSEQDAFDFRRITTDVTIDGQTFHSCFDVKALASCS